MTLHLQAPARQVLMALSNALIAPTELELREERLAKEAAAAELYVVCYCIAWYLLGHVYNYVFLCFIQFSRTH